MKKFLILLSTLFLITGCSKEIKFESIEKNTTNFHKINVAEKVNDGLLYYNGNNIIYEKNDNKIKLATNVKTLWRENNDIYYTSNDILYNYNFNSKETKKMVDQPHIILGKYNDHIISYSGRNIYSIKDTKKTKIFKNGYYLNRAILYKNKVYGIPATNVYEYNLDTLKVEKVTKEKHDMSGFTMINNNLYIITDRYKNIPKDKHNYTYFKVTDNGIKKELTIKGYSSAGISKVVKDGMFITTTSSDYNRKGSKLLYYNGKKLKTVDKNYYYDVIGIYDNKLLYYKSTSYFGSEEKNLKTFYLYNGKNNTKAFDLNINYYEGLNGYEYKDGILIELTYESSTTLYKYDGKKVEKLDTPYMFRIIDLDIIDNKAYIKYSDGEESTAILGTIVNLK